MYHLFSHILVICLFTVPYSKLGCKIQKLHFPNTRRFLVLDFMLFVIIQAKLQQQCREHDTTLQYKEVKGKYNVDRDDYKIAA